MMPVSLQSEVQREGVILYDWTNFIEKRLRASSSDGTQDARSNGVNVIPGIGYAVIGLGLVFRAAPLSLRYNAWTTRLRERRPNFNPPPTPEWRARNTKIMTIMFRTLGVILVVFSIMLLLPPGLPNPH